MSSGDSSLDISWWWPSSLVVISTTGLFKCVLCAAVCLCCCLDRFLQSIRSECYTTGNSPTAAAALVTAAGTFVCVSGLSQSSSGHPACRNLNCCCTSCSCSCSNSSGTQGTAAPQGAAAVQPHYCGVWANSGSDRQLSSSSGCCCECSKAWHRPLRQQQMRYRRLQDAGFCSGGRVKPGGKGFTGRALGSYRRPLMRSWRGCCHTLQRWCRYNLLDTGGKPSGIRCDYFFVIFLTQVNNAVKQSTTQAGHASAPISATTLGIQLLAEAGNADCG